MASAKHNRAPAQINRRSLLSAAPALGLAGLIAAHAAPVVASTETPIAVLFNEWVALWGKSRDLGGIGMTKEMEIEQDRVEDRMIEIENAMREMPKHGMGDILMAISATTNLGVLTYDDEVLAPLHVEARELIGGAA